MKNTGNYVFSQTISKLKYFAPYKYFLQANSTVDFFLKCSFKMLEKF